MAVWIVIFRRGSLTHEAKVVEFLFLIPERVGERTTLTLDALGFSTIGVSCGAVYVGEAKGIRSTSAAVEIFLGACWRRHGLGIETYRRT